MTHSPHLQLKSISAEDMLFYCSAIQLPLEKSM